MNKIKTRILLTGATGFVGRALLKSLLSCDRFIVRATYRASTFDLNSFAEWVLMPDLSLNSDWSSALKGVDVVIHLAARVHVLNDDLYDQLTEFRKVNVQATKNLASQAALAGVKRFIFISTIGVHGSFTPHDSKFTEESVINPQNYYSQSKWEAELELVRATRNTPMDFVIVRPPMIYGLNAPGNFGLLMKVLYRGWPLPFGALDNKRAMVSLMNFIDFILLLLSHPNAANQTFLVSDGHDISTTNLLRRVAFGMHKKVVLFFFPQFIIQKIAYFFDKSLKYNQLYGSLQVDITKAKVLLGWSPIISINEGLRQVGEDYVGGAVVNHFKVGHKVIK
jgi:nucleoside-diphosphate-sugar epimerase